MAKEIRGLVKSSEGLILKEQILMGLGAEVVERGLERKGNSIRGSG